ncbi:TetR/AcrR family transcriptional regulator [Paenibacillus sp. FSL K6-2524]|uniref:TetR/AcrR family transcriptional regulator n=1 Tax=Paenibacillus sp. FSL K6-2524 TaxID=2954516 RepID=UPI0030F53985
MIQKKDILYATLELASIHGLRSLSLSQIAESVGIKKASLYNHFHSKEELITNLYQYLREESKGNMPAIDYGEFVKGKSAEDVLTISCANYRKMIGNENMMKFYKVIMSERPFSKEAANILLLETEKMLLTTKQLFYAMQIHKLLDFTNIDMAALSYAMTIHNLIEYCIDKLVVQNMNCDYLFDEYINSFCELYKIKGE